MGGPNGAFQATHWREVLSVRTTDEARRRQALGQVIGRYWKPVYCYLRRKGHGNEEAKDLTQGFFHEMALRRGLFQKADRRNGRFRAAIVARVRDVVDSDADVDEEIHDLMRILSHRRAGSAGDA